MALLPKHLLKGCIVPFVLVGIYNEAMGQAQKADPPKSQTAPISAASFAAALWKKVTVVCPAAGGSEATFVYFPAGTSPINQQIVEFRSAWTKLVPVNVTEADRLNGVQSRALAFIGGSAMRHTIEMQGRVWIWSGWTDSRRLPLPKDLNDLEFRDFWDPVAVVQERHGNRWFYQLTDSTDFVDLDSLQPVPFSCVELTRTSLTRSRGN